MVKNGVKKIVKKKRKNLRNKLLKKQQKENNNLNSLSQNQENQNQPSNISQLHNNLPSNSLRAQLLARASMNPSLGFSPQQYGSITNEKRIDQLRTDNNTMNSQILNNTATYESLKNENKKLKKQIKERDRNYDKAKIEREMLEDKLEETKRVDLKTQREEERKNMIESQISEHTRQNKIIENQTEADKKKTQLQQIKQEGEKLKQEYEENKAYQELQQLNIDYQNVLNQNESISAVMKDPSFINPNKEIMQKTQDIMIAQHNLNLNKLLVQKQNELNEINVQIQSIPEEQYEAMTKQVSIELKNVNEKILTQKDLLKLKQKKVDEYNYLSNKLDEYNKQLTDLTHQNKMLQAEITKIDTQNRGDLNKALDDRIKTIGQTKVSIQQKDERAKIGEEIRRLNIKKAEQQAQIDYEKTEDYKKSFKDITDKKIEFIKAKNEVERQQQEYEINKKIEESRITNEIENITKSNGLAEIQQANDILDKYVKPLLNINEQKAAIINEINSLRNSHHNAWQVFLEQYDGIEEVLNHYEQVDISELQKILNAFKQMIKFEMPSIQIQQNQPPPNLVQQIEIPRSNVVPTISQVLNQKRENQQNENQQETKDNDLKDAEDMDLPPNDEDFF